MATKPWYFIKYKYEGQPWYEYVRTQVPLIVPHYEKMAMQENPGAVIQTFKDLK